MMMLLLVVALMTVVTLGARVPSESDGGIDGSNDEVEVAFRRFVMRYGRSYYRAGDAEEYARRLANFRVNYEFIRNHNADVTQTFRVGINHFADLSREEYVSQLRHLFSSHFSFTIHLSTCNERLAFRRLLHRLWVD